MATEGTFILADIGGYTSFLTGVGITHAKEITEHLLNRIVKTNRGQWKVGNIMGDCVFFYTDGAESFRQTFGRVRSLYEAFQDARTEIASGSTCRCGACNRTEQLSLKFVVHAGQYDVQNIAGRKELIGQDIIVATRLLKNSVPVPEYVIATPPAGEIAEAAGLPATSVRDDLEGIGPYEYSYIDLTPIREELLKSRQLYLTEAGAAIAITTEIDAPPDVVWQALSQLDKRAIWQVTIKEMMQLQGQKDAVGEVHSCVHSNGSKIVHLTTAIDEENRRKTERVWVSPPIMKDIYVTTAAEELPNGRTRACFYAAFKPRIPVVSHLARPLFVSIMAKDIRKDMAGLKELCETGTVAGRVPATVEA